MRSKSESISRSDGQSCQPQCSTNGRWYSTHGDPVVQHAWRSWLAWKASRDHGLHRRGIALVTVTERQAEVVVSVIAQPWPSLAPTLTTVRAERSFSGTYGTWGLDRERVERGHWTQGGR